MVFTAGKDETAIHPDSLKQTFGHKNAQKTQKILLLELRKLLKPGKAGHYRKDAKCVKISVKEKLPRMGQFRILVHGYLPTICF